MLPGCGKAQLDYHNFGEALLLQEPGQAHVKLCMLVLKLLPVREYVPVLDT